MLRKNLARMLDKMIDLSREIGQDIAYHGEYCTAEPCHCVEKKERAEKEIDRLFTRISRLGSDGPKMKNEWKRYSEDGDSYEVVKEFDSEISAEDILVTFTYPEGMHCMHSYDCCGNFYPGKVRIVRGPTKVQATQRFARNI